MEKINISVNVTAHNEGDFLFKTLSSIIRNINYAEDSDKLKIEVNINLDNSDKETRRIAELFKKNSEITNVFCSSFGDLGISRNFLISKSHGTYIAFFDGDDFFSENYLSEAFRLASSHNHKPAVYSPGWFMRFNEDSPIHTISQLKSSNDFDFTPTNCYEHNAYLSQLFVHRDIYEKIKYISNSAIYGYEDWHWDLSVLAAGYTFYTLQNVIFFYRTKRASESLLALSKSNLAILAPTIFFQPSYFKQLTHCSANGLYLESFFSRPLTQISVANEVTYIQQADHSVPRLGKVITKTIFGNSRFYHIIGLQYRATQQLLAPVVHKLRNNHLATHVLPLHHQTFITLMGTDKNKAETIGTIKPKRLDISIFNQLFDLNVERLASNGFTQLHLNLWKKLNDIEPLIRFSRDSIINTTIVAHNVPSVVKDVYFDFCNKYDGKITDILLIPHIVQGGADNAMIKLVEAMSKKGRKILVIATNNRQNTWRYRMEKIEGVVFLERHVDLIQLDNQAFFIMVTRIIQNWDISTLTIMNSTLGYEMVGMYGEALKKHVRIYVHTYMFDINDMGMRDYIFPITRIYRYTDHIITDGNTYKNELLKINGWDSDKITPVYLPISEQIEPCKQSALKNRFLFAGRLSDQKQIDLLLSLDEQFTQLNIKIDIYGARDELYCQRINFDEQIKLCNNIRYCGPFNNFATLPLSSYDGMIMPTINEGMPNVVLESIKANLFIITGDVGSIHEAVTSNKNGILVKENTEAQAYFDAIEKFYSSVTLQDYNSRLKINKKVIERHSLKNYTDSIVGIMNL